jgi:hypothetical protein
MARGGLIEQARGELLWGVVGFLLCQAVLAVAVEHWLGEVRDPEYAAKEERLRARQAEAPGAPLVVVLGSSRTKMGLRADRIRPDRDGALVFNFGLLGAGSMLERVCVDRLRAGGIRPDLVVVEVVPMMLNRRDGASVEENRLDGARLWAGEVLSLEPYYGELHRLLWKWGRGRVLPCDRHHAELRQALALDVPTPEAPPAECDNPIDGYGWQVTDGHITLEGRQQATAMSLRQYRDAFTRFRLAPGQVQALRDLVEECRGQGSRVAALVMPESSAFRACYSPEMTEAVDGLLARVRGEWGVPVVDARTWAADEDFRDGHHLLPLGAAAFTDRFAREALPALLGASGPERAAGLSAGRRGP